jgi:hypothetical protein
VLSFSQKSFRFQLPLSDNEIWGVGMVVCQWASIEDLLDHFIAHINKGPALNTNGAPLSFKSRVRLFKQILSDEVKDLSIRSNLIEVVDRIHGLQDERDRVVHHIWSDTRGKTTIFDWRTKNKKPAERPMDAGRLISLAKRIEDAKLAFMDMLIKHGEVQPDQPMFETAWKRITQPQ